MRVVEKLGGSDKREVRRRDAAVFLQREASLDEAPHGVVGVVACNDTGDAGTADDFAEGEGWSVGGFVGADEEAAHVWVKG